MGLVHVLDDRVKELISAGEVVDRPASVVKELVENALDAGATRIDIELRNNGLSSIAVSDNGKGIEEEDIRTAFLRHATSKISTPEDLNSIGSLGFRGEALAAISAVSKVRLSTKTPDNVTGYRYLIEGGREISLEECGTPTGTTITVYDLFYNTPARMKFLKKDVAEGNACEQLIWHMALTEPDVSFRLIREGKLTLRTTGQGLYSAIFDLFPREIASGMAEISYESDENVSVSGYVGSPANPRASRSLQHISVNGRFIRNRAIQSAAEEAYRGVLMQGRFPAFVISVNVPLDAVDVNVHPAKTEVRFTNERAVTRAVYRAVRDTVQMLAGRASDIPAEEKDDPAGSAPQRDDAARETSAPDFTAKRAETSDADGIMRDRPSGTAQFRDPARELFDDLIRIDSSGTPGNEIRQRTDSSAELDIFPEWNDTPRSEDTENEISQPETDESGDESEELYSGEGLRVIGELFKTYILAEAQDQLVLIDMHAAHERILYELIRDAHSSVDSQILLEPVVVSLSVDEKQALIDNAEQLDRLGFSVSELGEREVAVREIPTYLKADAVADAVTEIANGLISNREELTFEAREWLMHSSACRAAIKAGHTAPHQEMVSLAEQIIYGNIPKYCPHGRPVYYTVSRNEIEKRFGRTL